MFSVDRNAFSLVHAFKMRAVCIWYHLAELWCAERKQLIGN